MNKKLYLIFANFSLLQLHIGASLHASRIRLAENGYQWQANPNRLWQGYALDNLSAQYSSLWRYAHDTPDKKAFERAESAISDNLGHLAAEADPARHLVWLLGPLHNENLPRLIVALKQYPAFATREITPVIIGERQDDIINQRFHLTWRNAKYPIFSNEMFSPGAFANYARTYAILEDQLEGHAPDFIAVDPSAPVLATIRKLEGLLGLTIGALAEETYPFPRSYAGLAMAAATLDFQFSVKNKICHDKRQFLKILRAVEKERQFPLASGSDQSALDYLERFKESNQLLANRLGVSRLFPPCNSELYPEPLPGCSLEQATAFIEAFSHNQRHAFLRYFRDRKEKLNAEELTLATTLENYRQKMTPLSGFTFPRPEPALTVLTMTRNHQKFITECMESVSAQKTDFPIEHIIVDDASDDGSQDIIDNYASTHAHVRPIFLPYRSSGGVNVRTLFGACKSEFAALCDGDDYFTDPDKLQKQVNFLRSNSDCALCFHPVRAVYENNAHPSFIYPEPNLLPRGIKGKYYLSDIIQSNFIQTNSVVYRWRFQSGLPDWFRSDLIPSDWYWHILHAEIGKIGFLPDVMSVYRRHAASYYATSFTSSSVEHRRIHGMNELKTYWVINSHFKSRYFKPLSNLANGVLSDFLRIMMENDQPALLDEAAEKYPEFVQRFLQELKIVNKDSI